MRHVTMRPVALLLAVAIPSLGAATLAVALLEAAGVPNASSVYLVAVVVTAYAVGTAGAIASAAASFLLYNFLFTAPRFTFTVADPGVWLNVVLLLFAGIVVGQLAAIQRSRTEVARSRELEARALFRVSRLLATRPSTPAVLQEIAAILQSETHLERIWITLGPDDARERVAADTGSDQRSPGTSRHSVLRRMPGDEPARWIRVHLPGTGPRPRTADSRETYRVRIEAGDSRLGSIWALRPRSMGEPDQTETRLLSAAADQLGQALEQDRLAAESRAAEIARQSDALKSALLQSVSHDLRTPLASIRAAAGTLRPGLGIGPEEQRESIDTIDREVEYLNRLVTNLLDLSRIEAGALRAERDVFVLEDLVGSTLERLERRLVDRPLELELAAPPVMVDPVFLDDALTNVIENVVKYTAPGTPVRIAARALDDEPYVRLTVEDAGTGVPPEALALLFDKFYRVPGARRESRAGTGIGLAVVRGLVNAMGGRVAARRADLGGLAIDLDLPTAAVPAGSSGAAPS